MASLAFQPQEGDSSVARKGDSTLLQKQVEITSSFFERPISSSTVSLSTLSQTRIFQNNSTNISDAIDRMSGITITNSQTNIRGGSGFTFGVGSRVMVLVDGLPMLGAYEGDVRWHFLPIEQVNQIEVLKGASSALYGSSALNGVINVRTVWPTLRKPEIRVGNFFTAYGNPPSELNNPRPGITPIAYGSSFLLMQKLGKFEYVFGGQVQRDDSYRLSDFSYRTRGNLKMRYNGKRLEAGIQLNAMRDSAGVFFIFKSAQDGLTQYLDTSVNQVLKYYAADPYITLKTGKNLTHTVRGRIFYNLNRCLMGEYRSSWTPMIGKNKANLSWGAFYQYNVNLLRDSIHSVNRAAFVQFDHKVGKLTYSAGLRYEQFINLEKAPISFPVFRGGLNYEVKKGHNFRVSAGQGFRAPSLIEMYVKTTNDVKSINIFPNQYLRPEYAWSYEVGYRRTFKKEKWNGFVDASIFMQRYRDMIEFEFLVMITGTGYYPGFRSSNISKALIYGAEINGEAWKQISEKQRLKLSGGITRVEPLDLRSGGNPTSTNPKYLKYRQKWLVRADVQWEYKKFYAGVNVRWNSFMIAIDRPWEYELAGTIPGMKAFRDSHKNGDLLIDARAGVRFGKNWAAGFVGKNLLNTAFMMVPGSFGPTRQFSIQLNYNIL